MNWFVLGAGRSGIAARNFLSNRGLTSVLVEDSEMKRNALLQDPQLRPEAFLSTAQAIVKIKGCRKARLVVSPGVRPNHPLCLAARGAGHQIWSELDLALQGYQGKIIAVTGTNGKSTCVMMIQHLLSRIGESSIACGNIGFTATEARHERPGPDILVLEVSSYQAATTHLLRPDVAILTNLSQDHIDWHGSEREYFAAKWFLFQSQRRGQAAFICSKAWSKLVDLGFKKPESTMTLISPTSSSYHKTEFINEEHNQLNASFAIEACAKITGIDRSKLVPLLKDFRGLKHRFEEVGLINGGRVINDSKSTNIASSQAAIKNMSTPTTLMLGGLPKNESFEPFLRCLPKQITQLICFGKAASSIKESSPLGLSAISFDSLDEAMNHIHSVLPRGNSILFSPACASQDEFANFEDRGAFFTKKIQPHLN